MRSLRLMAWRPALLLAGGLALALVAEGSSLGLLGLSGWFIASCYLSGIDPTSTFSYLSPSGGVRAFALARILARYAERLVSHTATLQWLTRIRLRMFADAAAAPADRMRRLREGEALDRAMNDADTLDQLLIRTVVPLTTSAVVVASTAALIWAMSAAAGAAFLSAAVITGTVAMLTASRAAERHRRGAEPACTVRGRARAHLVASTDAWAEMFLLGAVPQARAAAACALDSLRDSEAAAARSQSRGRFGVDACAALTLGTVLTACLAGPSRMSLPDTALVTLLTTAVIELMAGLPVAVHAAQDAAEAARRLAVLAPHGTKPAGTPTHRLSAGSTIPFDTDADVRVTGLALSPSPGLGTPVTDCAVPAGGQLVVSGPSGSGKATLLRAIAGEIATSQNTVGVGGRPPYEWPAGRIVFVPHDDYVFTGTVADNLRLANPDLTDSGMEELLSAVSLSGAGVTASTPVGAGGRELSGGERRRLCLARAVARRPRLLLLDEPIDGVDRATAHDVMVKLRELLPDCTIVAAIHDKDAAAADWPGTLTLTLGSPTLGEDVRGKEPSVPA